MPDLPITRLNRVLDRLDTEDDDNIRADLIDEAIGLADADRAAERAWREYR